MKKLIYLTMLIFAFTSCSSDKDEESGELNIELSAKNKITSFKITPNQTTFIGTINYVTNTIIIETNGLESNNSIIPEIEISESATISPDPALAQDFNQNIDYTVTAENGDQATYTVITNTPSLSSEKKILNFQLDIDGDVFDGIIDHSNLSITVDTYKNPSYISPIITISENATISPDSSEPQYFTNPIQYTVTAEDQSSNVYTVTTKWISIGSINSAKNTTDLAQKYYSNATPYVSGSYLDLTLPNSKIVLENGTNSYVLNYTNYESSLNASGVTLTNFQIEFPANIVTANDYTLKYMVGNEVKSQSLFDIDVLAENLPDIVSANQTIYSFYDTLILYGTSLVEGLRMATSNGSIYQYNQSFMTLNADDTTLTFPLTVNQSMFPSWLGQTSPFPTQVMIYYNGRYGETIVLDFD